MTEKACAGRNPARDLEEVLSLLGDVPVVDPGDPSRDSVSDLIEEYCGLAVNRDHEPTPPCTIHHLACTGGSLISKVVAALPGVVLLSEIDPLSTMELAREKPRFAPTDVILALKQAARPVPERIVVNTFLASIGTMNASLGTLGHRLVIRDHAHSHFYTMVEPDSRPTLRELLLPMAARLRSVVTIRHPLDSFGALKLNLWKEDFHPFNLEEYCIRFQKFIRRYEDVPLVRYEDFVASPAIVLEEICDILNLPFDVSALGMIGNIRMTGDSGRTGSTIKKRPRRDLPDEIEIQRSSRPYRDICARFGYEP
ncbi:hypothetical protein SLG_28910 [Sphingobium sp. SYK-6]|uniref:sulfotransferase n=1 Tax=Sphingobium sp. (strain NBRC 103272 / SYK-6) TaxID=627192 RepID=UPI00022771E2|nr:sulfotransferase [Sphingobium sp. SYK-6]BAK67566.1 hypothetical protein SLG_28910 [Sphingobium sp. SYK-6]